MWGVGRYHPVLLLAGKSNTGVHFAPLRAQPIAAHGDADDRYWQRRYAYARERERE